MPKIIAGVGPTYPEGHAPGDGEEHVHPGTGEPMTGVEHPADGTMSPLAGNDGDGEPGEQVVQLPEGEFAEPEPYHIDSGDPGVHAGGLEVLKVPAEGAKAEEPAAEPPVPPKAPPRRPPSVTGSGGVSLPKAGAGS